MKGKYYVLSAMLFWFTMGHAQTTVSISSHNGIFKFASSTGDFESITLNTPVIFKIQNAETTIRQLCIINDGYDTVVNYNAAMLSAYFQNHTDKKIVVTADGIVKGMNIIGGKRVTIPFAILLNMGGGKKYAQKIGVASNHDKGDTATGIAYYDAFTLAKLVQKQDYSGIALLWRHYAPIATIRSNPFFDSTYVDKVMQTREATSTKEESAPSFSYASLNEFGVTYISDLPPQYHGKHDRLNASFFKNLKSFLTKYEEARTLFPSSYSFLNNVGSGQFDALLPGMRQAYNDDMANMTVGMNQMLDLPKYADLLKSFPEIRTALRTAKVVSEIAQTKDLKHPDVIMHELAEEDDWTALDSNLLNSWRLLDIISQSLHSYSQEMTWVSCRDFSELASDKEALKMYKALMYERTKGISFTVKGSRTGVPGFMATQAGSNDFADMCENFVLLANRLDKTIDDDGAKEDNKTLVSNDINLYIAQAMDVIQFGFRIANMVKPGADNDPCIVMAKNAEDMFMNTAIKSNGATIKNVYTIVCQIDTLAGRQVDRYNKAKNRLDELNAKKQLKGDEDMEKEILTEQVARLIKPDVYSNALNQLKQLAPLILKNGA